MKKLLLVLMLSTLSGCAFPLTSAGPGFLFTNTKEGVSVNNEVKAERSGEACQINIIGLIAVGDASIEAAKNKSGILSVAAVNRSFFGILGIFSQACTIVSGR
jgi:hypothetical protein